MTCPICGRWGAPCPDTGYDADEVCPTCQADGWTETDTGEFIKSGRERAPLSRVAPAPPVAPERADNSGDLLKDEDVPL